jgi:hypothetical protein
MPAVLLTEGFSKINRASFRQRGNLFVQDDPVGERNVETKTRVFTFLDLWHGRHRRDDGNRRMAPDRRTDRQACAAEGHMHQIDSIRYTQLRAHKMPW